MTWIVVLVQISMFAMISAFTFATYASVHLLLFGQKKIRPPLLSFISHVAEATFSFARVAHFSVQVSYLRDL